MEEATMKLDLYSKVVLTVIALALCVIAFQNVASVSAKSEGCGDRSFNPCHVTVQDMSYHLLDKLGRLGK